MPVDYAGNTLGTARELNINSSSQTFTDWVGSLDTKDYYRFSLSGRSSFNLALNNLSADANVQLIQDRNNNGSVDNNEVIASSTQSGTSAESIKTTLDAGTYHIQVYQGLKTANTNYSLTVSANPAPQSISDWINQNIQDSELRVAVSSRFTDSVLDRNDIIAIFRNAEDGGVIDTNELTDLRKIISNASSFNMPNSVSVLANKIVNGDTANQKYQGASLGNLYAGSSDTQMEKLISKWFLGGDRPLIDSGYSYNYANGSLFQNGISYQDVKQGTVGDCYFLAGLAETALHSSSTIESMFTDNGDHTYSVRFYKNGVADYVTVDQYLPTTSWGAFAYANMGGSYSSSSNELWVALAEKAYAQLNESGWIGQDNTNSYQGIAGGWDGNAVNHITGRSATYNSLDFNTMVSAFNTGKSITVGSKDSGLAANVVANHAYVVVGYNSSNQKFTLFNPWGVDGGYYDGNFKPGTLELTWSELTASFGGWTSATI